MIFEWEPAKAAANLKKHGVSFAEAAELFDDDLGITIYDPDHSHSEDRFVTIGHSRKNRLLLVVHNDRGAAVRIISGREMTRNEREAYEKEIHRRNRL